jgi:hypothetical protein
MLAAHARTQDEIWREADRRKPSDYLRIKWLAWVWHYLKSRAQGKWEFLDYRSAGPDQGIYDLAATPVHPIPAQPVRVSLVGDWGSGTADADEIARCVEREEPHLTIHLGDVYYAGTKSETLANMLGGKVLWPIGSRGSFALNANHEMYARGKAYFTDLLPALGIRESGGAPVGQKASFFALKNDHWLVIGLDTGYHSVGYPIFEQIFKPSAKLHARLIEWLRNTVRLQEDRQRGVILLSHHQYYSQFESGYQKSARQLADLLDRPVLWFWGHEHRFALYGKHATPKSKLEVYGRCLGHGGLPIEDIEDTPKGGRKYQVGLVLYDRRERTRVGASQTPVGYNGYATLVFEGNRLTVEYRDAERLLVTETWEVGDGGRLLGISIEQLVLDDGLVLHGNATLDHAIG